ncbi:hypothetical protein [Paenibacillus radicis (ex Xue et al. 2023)]|uniref:Uncharacterized protein n=1 Tax=Paenibacillus radicis (ex Xue et al. 2023) TaxID=2972489 RepID=A0ABT1YFT6_9BACL|nr:hypothetical protein [Paenibacillus radicis (ex Xue et al. 2023)]MCR8632062.1 hypothetical protein [Paenibacillus radicis (ex Xue et al. 2023)]
MKRISELTFVFPQNTEEEREWGTHFLHLLEYIPSFRQSSTALPRVGFRWDNGTLPAVYWSTSEDSDRPIPLGYGVESIESVQEGVLSMEQLYKILEGRLIGMDHAGVNIPTASITPSDWTVLLSELAERANLYRYPGEDWPFILPAEEGEFETDITNFSVKRTPKFELVHDKYTKSPIFQFALETDLSRKESEALFPDPIGFAIPGLDEIFRSLFIRHPWEREMAIRFDLYYKPASLELSDWETGEWLVMNGGRMVGDTPKSQ